MTDSMKLIDVAVWLMDMSEYLSDWKKFFDGDRLEPKGSVLHVWHDTALELEAKIETFKGLQINENVPMEIRTEVRAHASLIRAHIERELRLFRTHSSTKGMGFGEVTVRVQDLESLSLAMGKFYDEVGFALKTTVRKVWSLLGEAQLPAFESVAEAEVWNHICNLDAATTYIEIGDTLHMGHGTIRKAFMSLTKKGLVNEGKSGKFLPKEEFKGKEAVVRSRRNFQEK